MMEEDARLSRRLKTNYVQFTVCDLGMGMERSCAPSITSTITLTAMGWCFSSQYFRFVLYLSSVFFLI